MKILVKVLIFILIVTIGIVAIDTSLSALRESCRCQNDSEAQGECTNICWDTYRVDCLMTVQWDEGCEFGDCVTTWKFYCENGAKGYFSTIWHYCADCETIPQIVK